MSLAPVWLVIQQEFRIRLRTGRWRWLMGAWVAVLLTFTFLLDLGLETGYGYTDDDTYRGVPLFGFLMFFILGVMLIISPALTSQTINGDRERGTLATLQVTRLRPVEIAVGKLLAGWGVGLVALALSLPFAGYAMLRGGITAERMAAVYGVVALLIGVICAVSQALSALLARSITSALLSYLTAGVLAVGTLVAFALAVPLTEDRVPSPYGGYNKQTHEERVWWLLAPNPFVILADAAPRVPPRITRNGDVINIDDYDPLSQIGRQVRRLRYGQEYYDYGAVVCQDVVVTPESPNGVPDCAAPLPPPDLPVWPYGLGFSVLLGVGAVVLTTVRLRTPTHRLARGVRVA
jgi:ABC-type transport system involved in multi-copper enzyme maturation permease subunit